METAKSYNVLYQLRFYKGDSVVWMELTGINHVKVLDVIVTKTNQNTLWFDAFPVWIFQSANDEEIMEEK